MLIVDDSHGLGKALGGAAGGFVAGDAALCRVLEQRSRPQLFSNGLAPTVPASSRRALGLLAAGPDLVDRLRAKVATFRRLLEDGVFVTGFGFPVVPEGTARIRAQISAAHTEAQLTRAADALAAALA